MLSLILKVQPLGFEHMLDWWCWVDVKGERERKQSGQSARETRTLSRGQLNSKSGLNGA